MTVSAGGFILAIVSFRRTLVIVNAALAIAAEAENTGALITTGRVRAGGEPMTLVNAKGTLVNVDADTRLVATESKRTHALVRATSILAHFTTGTCVRTRGTLINIVAFFATIASLALAFIAAACVDTIGVVLANVRVVTTLVHIVTVVSRTGKTDLTVALIAAHIVDAFSIGITRICRLTLVNVATCAIFHGITSETKTLERAMRVFTSCIRRTSCIVATLVNIIARASITLEPFFARACEAAVSVVTSGIIVAHRRDALVDIITVNAITAVATLAKAYE